LDCLKLDRLDIVCLGSASYPLDERVHVTRLDKAVELFEEPKKRKIGGTCSGVSVSAEEMAKSFLQRDSLKRLAVTGVNRWFYVIISYSGTPFVIQEELFHMEQFCPEGCFTRGIFRKTVFKTGL